jgi:Protein of unknown function (DUF3149)
MGPVTVLRAYRGSAPGRPDCGDSRLIPDGRWTTLPRLNPLPEDPMEALKLLLTSDVGLLSLGAIVFMIVMAIYLFTRFRRLMNEKPGKEGWN